MRGVNSNRIAGNATSDNGDHRAHVGYGIDIAGRSHNNIVENNDVRGNADEGIHVGAGSHNNRFANNTVADNYRENLYVLGADGNVFVKNTLGGGGVNSLYFKDSSRNLFEGNTFRGKPARIIGASRDNRFVDNTFAGAGLHFTMYRRDARYPYRNLVVGGRIADVTPCVRFTNSRDNVVDNVALSGCGTAVRGESTSAPAELTVLGATPQPVALDEGSTLHVGQAAAIHVKDAAGASVAGAAVQAKDSAGSSLWSATTDHAGATPPQPFVTATLMGTRRIARGPITVTVTKPGYAPSRVTDPVIENRTLAISIRPE
jgi:parallel beta-helix repeat protein